MTPQATSVLWLPGEGLPLPFLAGVSSPHQLLGFQIHLQCPASAQLIGPGASWWPQMSPMLTHICGDSRQHRPVQLLLCLGRGVPARVLWDASLCILTYMKWIPQRNCRVSHYVRVCVCFSDFFFPLLTFLSSWGPVSLHPASVWKNRSPLSYPSQQIRWPRPRAQTSSQSGLEQFKGHPCF